MTREPTHTEPPREQLSAWLDGELSEAEAAELEAELARDPALRAELDELETVVRLLREEGPSQAPLGFHHRVMAKLDEEHPPRASAWAWLRRPFGIPLEGWAIGLAAALALLLVLPGEDEASAPPPPTHESPAAVELPKKGDPAPVTTEQVTQQQAAPSPEKGVVRKGVEQDLGPRGETAPAPVVIPGVATTGEPEPGPPAAPPEPQGTSEQVDPTAYHLVIAEGGRKRDLLRLMAQYGVAHDGKGNPVKDPKPQSRRELLVVDVPKGELSEFWARLNDLHLAVLAKQDPTGITSGETVRVILQLEGTPPVNRATKGEGEAL